MSKYSNSNGPGVGRNQLTMQRFIEAYYALQFINQFDKDRLNNMQMHRLIRYVEKLQLNNIDGVEGDPTITAMRKEASKIASRLLKRLVLDQNLPTRSNMQNNMGPKAFYCIGVHIGYTETMITLLIHGKVAYHNSNCMGLFVKPPPNQKVLKWKSTPQNALIDIMQNVFEVLLSYVEYGLIPTLPLQIYHPDGSVASNTEQLIISTASPSPMVSRLLLVRAWNEMIKSMAHVVEQVAFDLSTQSGGISGVGGGRMGSMSICSPGRINHGYPGQSEMNSPIPIISGVCVIHTHSGITAAIAAYYSPQCYPLFRTVVQPFHTLPSDDVLLEILGEQLIRRAITTPSEADTTVDECSPHQQQQQQLRAQSPRCVDDVYYEECCLHVLISTEDMILYISVVQVTTCWKKQFKAGAVDTGVNNSSDIAGNTATSDNTTTADVYEIMTSSRVKWLHHSRHCYKPLFMAKHDPAAGITNPVATAGEMTEYIDNVWQLHVLNCPVSTTVHDSHNSTTNDLPTVLSYIHRYPIRAVHYVGKEMGIYAARHESIHGLVYSPTIKNSSATSTSKPSPGKSTGTVTDNVPDQYRVNNSHHNERTGVFARQPNRSYSESQHQRHRFITCIHGYMVDQVCSGNLHPQSELQHVALRNSSDIDVSVSSQAHNPLSSLIIHHGTKHYTAPPTAAAMMPVLMSFEFGGVENEALGAALYGSMRIENQLHNVYNPPQGDSSSCAKVDNESSNQPSRCNSTGLSVNVDCTNPTNTGTWSWSGIHSDCSSPASGGDGGGRSTGRGEYTPWKGGEEEEDTPLPSALPTPLKISLSDQDMHHEAGNAADVGAYSVEKAVSTSTNDQISHGAAVVSDISGYTVGIRSNSRLSSLSGNRTRGDHSHEYKPVNSKLSSLFMPFITSSMTLPATVSYPLNNSDLTDDSSGVNQLSNTGGPLRYQFDIMVSSNIHKFFCRPVQYARISVEDSVPCAGLVHANVKVQLFVSLTLNEKREILVNVYKTIEPLSSSPSLALTSSTPPITERRELLRQQRVPYTPQLQELPNHINTWICPTMSSYYKELGNSEMHKASDVKREVTQSSAPALIAAARGTSGQRLTTPMKDNTTVSEASSEMALSAQQEEQLRVKRYKQRHISLQLALLYYSEALRYDPCNHVVLSNRCAVLTHLENSAGNTKSNRKMAQSTNNYPHPVPRSPLFINKATLYLATIYLFSALFDAKECLRCSHFTFSKGFIRLGAIYYHLKKFEKSLEFYKFALYLDPSSTTINHAIIDLQTNILNITSPPEKTSKSIAGRILQMHQQKDQSNRKLSNKSVPK